MFKGESVAAEEDALTDPFSQHGEQKPPVQNFELVIGMFVGRVGKLDKKDIIGNNIKIFP